MSGPALLTVDALTVQAAGQTLLRQIGFQLQAGQVLTLLGESGAGKSLLAQAIMGNLPPALKAGGWVTLNGHASRASDVQERRQLWGRHLALLPQEPAQALDPLMRLAPQLQESLELVRGVSFEQTQSLSAQELQSAGLGHAARSYPWQLSGGMAQRAAALVACAGGAQVVLADEPTKGLDAYWRQHVVAQLQAVQRSGGCVVVITHDLQVAQALGGQLMVLRAGEVVEQGATQTILAQPQHHFTRQLLAADPVHWPRRAPPVQGPLVLRVEGLSKRYGAQVLFENLDLELCRGQRLALQGPSGSGKSTLGNLLLGLLPADRGTLKHAQGLAPYALQKLYQDPVASFAPTRSLEDSLRDVAQRHRYAWGQLQSLLERMGVAHSLLQRRPAAVSGGELQRIALARVLMVEPALLFADEPTSRLDPLSQQQAMQLLLDETEASGAALLLVTHDEELARWASERSVQLPSMVD